MSEPEPAPARKSALAVIFLTVLIDLIGFGIFMPLLAPHGKDLGGSDPQNGLLVGIFSLFQFLCMPLWGRLSDRIGRRPVLLTGLFGTAVSHVVFGLAGNLTLLFVSRALAGAFGATISTAQAYVADVTTPQTRSKGMGMIGAAFGIGFVFGPVIGGLLVGVSPRAPAFFAAGLSFCAFLFGYLKLPEPDRSQRDPSAVRKLSLRGLGATLADPRRGVLVLLFVFSVLAFSCFESMFTRLGQERLAFDKKQMSYVFAATGFVVALVQGGMIHRLTRRFGERRIFTAGSTLLALGLLGLAADLGVGVFLASALVVGLGYGLLAPSINALLSRNTPSEAQGATFGVAQSGASLARFAGGALAGWAFAKMHAGPFVGAAALLLLSLPLFGAWSRRFETDLDA